MIPERYNGIIFTPCLVSWSCSPVADKQLPLIRSASENRPFLVFVESDIRSSHGAPSLRSKKVKSIACFPVDQGVLDRKRNTSVISFFWLSRNFFSQRRTCPSAEIVANWLIYAPEGWIKAEYDFFISISSVEGNHLRQTTGVLCEGTFLRIWSDTGIMLEGSCRADKRLGLMSLTSFFYDLFPFFLLFWPSWTFFKSQSKIWPLIVPATIIEGSFGLNSKVVISRGELRMRSGSMACMSS